MILRGEVMSYSFRENLLPLIEEHGRKPSDRAKGIANLVIDEPGKRDSDLMDSYTDALLSSSDAITNAILAAGYDLVVTASPMENADLYYVFSPGMVFDEGQDLPRDLASLTGGTAPVFYQVVGRFLPGLTGGKYRRPSVYRAKPRSWRTTTKSPSTIPSQRMLSTYSPGAVTGSSAAYTALRCGTPRCWGSTLLGTTSITCIPKISTPRFFFRALNPGRQTAG